MKIYICNDSFGQRINAGDLVELRNDMELHTTWTSRVYWNPVDGAFLDGHPSHVKMGLGVHRNLREFLNQEDVETEDYEGNPVTYRTYCKKIKSKHTRI